MQVGLLVNPAAGRGRAERYARDLGPSLARKGRSVEVCHLNPAPAPAELVAFVSSCDALIVLGGDGTLQSVVDAAAAGQTPVYHAPFGTENLFARELRMSASIDDVHRALDVFHVEHLDLGRSGNGDGHFVIRASNHALVHQLDGEAAGAGGSARGMFRVGHSDSALEVTVEAGVLPVLRG